MMRVKHAFCHKCMGCTMQNMSSDICAEQRPLSACVSVQSDQGLHLTLSDSFDTFESMENKVHDKTAHVQVDVNLYILSMLNTLFCLTCSKYIP